MGSCSMTAATPPGRLPNCASPPPPKSPPPSPRPAQPKPPHSERLAKMPLDDTKLEPAQRSRTRARPKAPEQVQRVIIEAPRLDTVAIRIVGIAPYMQHNFSARNRGKIEAQQRLGERAKKGAKREPRDFEAEYQA